MPATPGHSDPQARESANERNEAGEATASQQEPTEALQALVKQAATLLGAAWARLWLLDGEGALADPIAFHPPTEKRSPADHPAQGLAGKVVRSRQAAAHGADLAVPVRQQGRLLGVLAVGAPRGDEGYALLALLASHAGLLIENEHLRQRERQLREEKDEFVSIVSHEFKTPLTAIKGFSQLVARRLGEQADAATTKYLQTIDQQATRLARFANDMVTYSRLESGQLKMASSPLDLVALVRQCADALLSSADRHILCVNSDEETLTLVGDPERLRQVISVLLGNAIKYSPDGGEVQVGVRRQDQDAVLSVRDQGIGMSEEQRVQVFRRFYRADQAMAMGEGTGLSLAIARGIVEAHGGRIWVESEPERGSTFYLSLPVSN